MDDQKHQTQGSLLDWFRTAPLRMARTPTELFGLLAFFDPQEEWSDFVSRIDFTGVTPGHIYQTVLGRSPDSIDIALGSEGYDPAHHFSEALLCPEFRQKVQSTFLRSYPEKGRDVFIHVPKCAGTDLILNLGRRSVPLPKTLELRGWISDSKFLQIVAGLARAVITSDRLFAYGHMELGEYVSAAGIRPQDRIFTVLRDPVDLMISQANYAIGRLRQDPIGTHPDTAEYLRILGLPRLPERTSPGEWKDLTLRALLDPGIAEPNRACFYLGRENQCQYAVAMENLVIHNVEITTTEYYSRWIEERWNLPASIHHNRSDPILTNAEARRLCESALADVTAEDQKLFNVVSWALRKSGAASIYGQDLARLAGSRLVQALSHNSIPELPEMPRKPVSTPNMLIAAEREFVELYLAPTSIVVPGAADFETVFTASFGVEGQGDNYRLSGWALPEVNFTWTEAKVAQIRLPPLPGEGHFTFRMVTEAFVSPGNLEFQQVQLLVGGQCVGTCEVRDVSVLECELPSHLLHENEPIIITLYLPDAVSPCLVSDSDDDRVLALAVNSIAVFRSCATSVSVGTH